MGYLLLCQFSVVHSLFGLGCIWQCSQSEAMVNAASVYSGTVLCKAVWDALLFGMVISWTYGYRLNQMKIYLYPQSGMLMLFS